MTRRMVIMLIAVAIVFGGIFGFQAFKASMIKKFMTAMGSPPQTVSATKAAYGAWQPKLEAIGTLRAVKGADLSLDVPGVVASISFNSGDDVEQGAPLLKLRVEDDLAKLESLQAMAELSDIVNQRDQKQFKMQAVSQATLRYRRRQPEKRQGAGGAAAGDHRQEVSARAVRRPPRHSRRRPRTISGGRNGDRHAAGARSDLCRFFRAAAGGRSGAPGPSG